MNNNYDELTLDDIVYKLDDGIVPKLYIKGEETGVVSMTVHYVTSDSELRTNTITFVYLTGDSPEQKILSINRNTGDIFIQ